MSTPPSTAPAELLPVAKALKTAALNGRIVGEAPLIISCACLAMIFFSAISTQVAADSWLNLLAGREIVHHGLPHHDALAVMSQGREWIDQQWLANVFYYALYAAGGVGFVARANVLLFVVVLALIFIVTRRRGATQLSVMLCCIPACLVGLEFIRAQVLVEPLLVLLIALLSAESRRPSVRVVFAFPMLALWANLHGSVLLAAALVSLLGLVELVQELRLPRRSRRRFVRAAGLFVAPWFFVFVSPYGLGVARYYDTTLRNPMFP